MCIGLRCNRAPPASAAASLEPVATGVATVLYTAAGVVVVVTVMVLVVTWAAKRALNLRPKREQCQHLQAVHAP